MRLAFAGTPAFARVALRALLDAGHEVELVLTQPDRPAGRGLKARPSEVKTLALERGLPTLQPAHLKSPESLAELRAVQAPVVVVVAYGLILPQAVLDLFPLGCINIHASLLPRWRGAAPIQRAILAGDRETGISIMRMEAGLDSGPVLLQESVAIGPHDTASSLHDKLAELGARCVVTALRRMEAGPVAWLPQPAEGVTYAHKLEKHEAAIDWSRSALDIDRQVRAFNPFPVAGTLLRGEPLRIWRARAVASGASAPGTVIAATDDGVLVGCGEGAVMVEELQRPGGKRLPAAEFLHGAKLAAGERLGV